ncbi:hypothetical protein ADIMK_1839 [Marinobacterium lacunae]|uniref:Alanine racemase N-terminal domain-containing protein n=1 Tax=Marinobacterium lacunae TaxID=1232683 RepID=A0A081FZZ9_9GAMM|nr:alanine racemase [Marinobacterium lacunae]KEA64104.1 hypothetical protein ADIMK_1839 [Marinobacterium lacunae]
MVSRRRLLVAGGAVMAGLAFSRPETRSGKHSAYFDTLNTLLRREGIDRPVLLIDLERLDRNIDRVMATVNAAGGGYRIVTKSVPAAGLVDYIAERAGTRSLMVFHRPFLEEMARLRPNSDILIGKPLPLASLSRFYDGQHHRFDPERQLQWLVDSRDRLEQYLAFAKSRDVRLRVNLEIDVGLHRGGFDNAHTLHRALTLISENPGRLKFAGFMGYDAHVAALPPILAGFETTKVKARYADAIALLREQFPHLINETVTFNGAGSPTFRHYGRDSLLNDISVGSALLKPSHYDLDSLSDFEPSAFIASPVLKRRTSTGLPTLEWLAAPMRAWDGNRADTLFIYGGNWLAQPESPPGIELAEIYRSSNQEGYYASKAVDLAVDDFLFLRPSQSEAVLLQFGELIGVREGYVERRWPVLRQGMA